MQDTDPAKRLGVGPDGYVSLKNHPFFRGIDWNDIRSKCPPKLVLEKVYLLFLLIGSLLYLNSASFGLSKCMKLQYL